MSEKNKEEIKTASQPAEAREFLGDRTKALGTFYQEAIPQWMDAYARQQTAALTDKLCKIQDDIASLVSSHRSDWSWNDVIEDVKNLIDRQDVICTLAEFAIKNPENITRELLEQIVAQTKIK